MLHDQIQEVNHCSLPLLLVQVLSLPEGIPTGYKRQCPTSVSLSFIHAQLQYHIHGWKYFALTEDFIETNTMSDPHASDVPFLWIQGNVSITGNGLVYKLDYASRDQSSLLSIISNHFWGSPIADCKNRINEVTSQLLSARNQIIARTNQSQFDVRAEEQGFVDAVTKTIDGIYSSNAPIAVIRTKVDVDKVGFTTKHPSLHWQSVLMQKDGSIRLTYPSNPETIPGLSIAAWTTCFTTDTGKVDTSIPADITHDPAITDLSKAAWTEVSKITGPTIFVLPRLFQPSENSTALVYEADVKLRRGNPIHPNSDLYKRLCMCLEETDSRLCTIGDMRSRDVISDRRPIDLMIEASSWSDAVSLTVRKYLEREYPEFNFQVFPANSTGSAKSSQSDRASKEGTEMGWRRLEERTQGYSQLPNPDE